VIRLAVRVPRERAEAALAELLELAPSGVEEVDLGDRVEYAVYGAPGELPTLPDLEALAGGGRVEISTSEIADDWAERWRSFHRPLVLPGRLRVRPPWEPPGPEPVEVEIDPGRAFGTGSHATTRLCLELLLELPARGSLLDAGCGSGVLAIAAARLGFSPVLAVDNDRAAIEATGSNAAANGIALEARRLDLRREELPEAKTVVANLLTPLLLECADRLARAPRALIVAGLLEDEAEDVAGAFEARGLAERRRRSRDGWSAVLLTRG